MSAKPLTDEEIEAIEESNKLQFAFAPDYIKDSAISRLVATIRNDRRKPVDERAYPNVCPTCGARWAEYACHVCKYVPQKIKAPAKGQGP